MQGLTRFILALCLLATPALGQDGNDAPAADPAAADATTSAESEAPRDQVGERDRLWSNYTRETAVIGDGNLRLGVQMLLINKSSKDNEPDLTGFPFDDFEEALEISTGIEDIEVESVEGTRFDIIGSYGLGPTSEFGFDIPVFDESIKFEDNTQPTINTGDIGDMIIYAKWRKMLTSRFSLGTALEMSLPTGSESKRLGTGELAFNPVVNARYGFDHIAVGGHIGIYLPDGSVPEVLNYSTYAVARASELFAFRLEVTGRFFRDFGEDYHDVSLWPGLDFNVFDRFTIRPQGLIHLNDDAWEWGIGVGLFADFGVGSIVDLMMGT